MNYFNLLYSLQFVLQPASSLAGHTPVLLQLLYHLAQLVTCAPGRGGGRERGEEGGEMNSSLYDHIYTCSLC